MKRMCWIKVTLDRKTGKEIKREFIRELTAEEEAEKLEVLTRFLAETLQIKAVSGVSSTEK